MHLTPREQEKLLIYTAGQLAADRMKRGLKLNHPEAVAYLTAAVLEGIRDGKSVSELMTYGTTLLSHKDVMPGVPEMIETRDALGSWDKPVLVAFSDTDPVFPFPRAGERFTELIPTAGEQVRVEGAAHFLQEDRGREIADAMLTGFGHPVA